MRVLAIDPGYGRCGMALLERAGGKDMLLFSDCIETAPEAAFTDRLAEIIDVCERLIAEHTPDCMALEKLYFNSNKTTAMRVAEVRGALLSAAARSNLPIHEYTPGEIKSAATGDGRADKHAVARMLHLLLKIDKHIRHDDEYDAIAVGVTHLARAGVLAARKQCA